MGSINKVNTQINTSGVDNKTKRSNKVDKTIDTPSTAISDKVSLSNITLKNVLHTIDDQIDVEKVNRLKQDIANGSFKVNANVIADNLIKSVKELIG